MYYDNVNNYHWGFLPCQQICRPLYRRRIVLLLFVIRLLHTWQSEHTGHILSNNHTTFLYVILPQNIVLEEKLTQKIKCKVICGLFSGWKIWPCIVLPSMKVRLTTCYFSTDKVFSRYAYFILTMRQIVTWVLTLILTNKMLPAYVNWSRTRLETEGNWRCNLKST